MRGRQCKRLRHLAKIQAGRMLIEKRDEIGKEDFQVVAARLVSQMYRVLKRAWKKQCAPKSLLYVDVNRGSRTRLQQRLLDCGMIERS